MTAKEYLLQVQKLQEQIKRKERQLRRMKSVTLSSPALGDKVNVSSKNINPMDKILELEEEINEEKIKYMDKTTEITKKIECVYNPDWIDVLTHKYIDGMSFEKIAELKHKSSRTISVWHGQALELFRKETGLKELFVLCNFYNYYNSFLVANFMEFQVRM